MEIIFEINASLMATVAEKWPGDTAKLSKLSIIEEGAERRVRIASRRWMKYCNPQLSDLISSKIGSGWIKGLEELSKLEKLADDKQFQTDYMRVKNANKQRLADWVAENLAITLNTDAIFDARIQASAPESATYFISVPSLN